MAWATRYGPDACAFGFITLALVSSLAVIRPEGVVAEPIGQFLLGAMGRLALLAPVWMGALGILILALRESDQEWPRARLIAAAIGTLSLLGLTAMEGVGTEGWAAHGAGGGLIGRA